MIPTETFEMDGITVHCRIGTIDRDIAHACIVDDEYHLKDLVKKADQPWPIFIDIGAYAGNATQLAYKLGMRCLMVEPLVDNLELIALNFKDHPVPTIPKAIGMSSIFWNAQSTEMESRHRFVANGSSTQDSGKGNTQIVDPATLKEVIDWFNDEIFLVKMDCEGGEWHALKSPSEVLNRIQYITGEFHPIYGTYQEFKGLAPMFEDISSEYGINSETPHMRLFVWKRK